jgi:hypothetical protein
MNQPVRHRIILPSLELRQGGRLAVVGAGSAVPRSHHRHHPIAEITAAATAARQRGEVNSACREHSGGNQALTRT